MAIVDVINTFTAQLDSAFEYFIVNLQYSLSDEINVSKMWEM